MEQRKEHPLKWPGGWTRTRIQDRKSQASWKKSSADYLNGVIKELARMRVAEVLITFNSADCQRDSLMRCCCTAL